MKRLLLIFALVTLSACSSVAVEDYADARPQLVPETFFDGQLTAFGVVKNRGGKVIRRFEATIAASWVDGVGTLDEDFIFDDGEEQKRVWTLTPDGSGGYRATAGDVVGDGTMQASGNALFLDYVLRIPYNDGTIDVRVDDRMYLVSEDVLINESVMKKFGVRVGNIVLTIVRSTPGSA